MALSEFRLHYYITKHILCLCLHFELQLPRGKIYNLRLLFFNLKIINQYANELFVYYYLLLILLIDIEAFKSILNQINIESVSCKLLQWLGVSLNEFL